FLETSLESWQHDARQTPRDDQERDGGQDRGVPGQHAFTEVAADEVGGVAEGRRRRPELGAGEQRPGARGAEDDDGDRQEEVAALALGAHPHQQEQPHPAEGEATFVEERGGNEQGQHGAEAPAGERLAAGDQAGGEEQHEAEDGVARRVPEAHRTAVGEDDPDERAEHGDAPGQPPVEKLPVEDGGRGVHRREHKGVGEWVGTEALELGPVPQPAERPRAGFATECGAETAVPGAHREAPIVVGQRGAEEAADERGNGREHAYEDRKKSLDRTCVQAAQTCSVAIVADMLVIRGAREHNLKNLDLQLPRDKLIVFTGLSGSGKSSLAFDTIYAEGQRRYVESLSAYARQFLGQMDKPDVDFIEGLSPAISIDQKSASRNPRSTVGTIT